MGYEGPAQYIYQPNLASAREAPGVIDEDLAVNLQTGRVGELLKQSVQSIVSPLGLVPSPLVDSAAFSTCHPHQRIL